MNFFKFVQENHAYWHFHELGISDRHEIRNMTRLNVKVGLKELLSFDGIQVRLGHVGRRVDYMKLDVENDEWQV